MANKDIDWKTIHQHLTNTQQVIEKKDESIEDANHMLRNRANELAQELIFTEKHRGVNILNFMLGSEQYGIESSYVFRVCEAKNITHLPSTPEFIEGVINIHGIVVCVINLKEVFGMPKSAPSDLNRILIINHDDINFGILADAVTTIESVELDKLQESLPTLTGIRSKFLLGITNDQKIILNIRKLMMHDDLIINDYV